MQAIRNPVDAARFAASVIRRHVPDPAYRVFLFGSRATRSAGERSDIDIGIEGPAPVSRAALAAIHDEFEEAPTLYTIEVVDFARVSRNFARSQNGRSRCDKSPIAADGFRKSGGPPRRSPRPAQASELKLARVPAIRYRLPRESGVQSLPLTLTGGSRPSHPALDSRQWCDARNRDRCPRLR
jgi:predicted nucleotidyltransferase